MGERRADGGEGSPFLRGVVLTLALGLAATGAAAAPETPVYASEAPTQLVVRFVDPVASPPPPGLLADLSRQAGVSLVYLRPLSGGYHLFSVSGAVAAADVDEAVARLARHPDVSYAGLDPVVHTQCQR